MTVLYILAEAPLIYLMNPGKAMNVHSSSNGPPSSHHSIPFPLLRGDVKSDILYEMWD